MAPSGNGNMLQIYQGERFDCDADDGRIVDRIDLQLKLTQVLRGKLTHLRGGVVSK